ncbi:hypothetical protein CXG50_04460 [Pseudomonas plecoglossicida]|uniref:Uncharacterized protein n=1 Tax=Pseudomonas plecoglossicida TaxID=70775 RepID=A0ABX4U230_PSEDL|nr:hypothetical protein CX682_20890 [Pseudomonas sp. FFUP_PS_41]PLU87897.1 hypothetical protein CXG44_07325 [Pseudomonas plecoglossicida]PLU95602.1 hypothetical protein CXG45_00755 [Pseudomonas plecoglossicida]PLV07082.1 hypothetical protein CXG48_02505 [Pseudomonas plecoglossicida]PLV11040.1 hypothetical protein CXG50_04460 [Pseudomonas plecoglossicida]
MCCEEAGTANRQALSAPASSQHKAAPTGPRRTSESCVVLWERVHPRKGRSCLRRSWSTLKPSPVVPGSAGRPLSAARSV